MGRPKDVERYEAAKEALLDVGVELMGSRSYTATGINTILEAAGIPKGSFYHYFKGKDDFGLQVIDHYHRKQMAVLRRFLEDERRPASDRLRTLLRELMRYYRGLGFTRGCLIGTLTLELADADASFREKLAACLDAQCAVFEQWLTEAGTETVGLGQLNPKLAARAIQHSIEGALMRMQAERSDAALKLLEKTYCAAQR
ncbi:MAG: TetR/AcrR family transcriptional regulator [Myxococcales bacterium]|nr:TetR/AcrR family transcriptional regulator [Myxococcales bacterium]